MVIWTINSDLDVNKFRDKITFLGLEPVISMWYTGEENWKNNVWYNKNKSNKDKYGYIYEFEVVKPIPVDKIINVITSHPSYDLKCRKYKNVCIHPQITLRYPSRYKVFDLSIEITMPLKKLVNEGFIKQNTRYRTSIENLEKYDKIPLRELKVIKYKDLLLFYDKDKKVDEKYIDSLL